MQQNSNFVAKNSKNYPEFEKDFRCFPCFLQLIYVVIATPYFFMYKKTRAELVKSANSEKLCQYISTWSSKITDSSTSFSSWQLQLSFGDKTTSHKSEPRTTFPFTGATTQQFHGKHFPQHLNSVKYFGSKKYHDTHQIYSLVPIFSCHMTTPQCLI